MSPLRLVRQLPEGREEHGIDPRAVAARLFGELDQLTEPCLVQAGCQFPEPCKVVCWLNVRER
jgi:hypothetical protein